MSTEQTHTSVPWYATDDDRIIDGDGYVIEGSEGIVERDDREFIVRAVNSHDDLLAALKAFFAKWPDVERVVNGYIGLQFARTGQQYNGPNIGPELEQMKAALARAEGR